MRIQRHLLAKLRMLLMAIVSVGCTAVPNPSNLRSRARFESGVQQVDFQREMDEFDGQAAIRIESEILTEQLLVPNLPSDNRQSERVGADRHSGIVTRIANDHRDFYDIQTMAQLGVGLGVGAILANSSMDQAIQQHFQSSVQGATTDEYFEFLRLNKNLGDGTYTLPIFSLAWGLGAILPENEFANTGATWGERSLRGFLVGGPPMLILQNTLGASRPGEGAQGSQWRPFADDNGVSGHAFMSALPFLTAARMTNDQRLKTMFYLGSALGPLSRVNDGAHYTSQALLGWWFAYLAAAAVDDSDIELGNWKWNASYGDEGPAVGLIYRY